MFPPALATGSRAPGAGFRALATGFHTLAAGSPAPPAQDSLRHNCGQEPSIVCRLAWDVSHSDTLARVAKVYLAGPITVALRIVFVLLLAFVIRFLVHRLINRITAHAANGGGADSDHRHTLLPERSGERRSQRSHALRSILGNAASIVIFGIAAITILGDLGVNLAPILASAGVLGVALGFGAQNLVGDFQHAR